TDHDTDHVAAATGAKRTTESASTTAVRVSTFSEPRRKTFQPACRNAAATASASASSGTGRVEERVTELPAELVPLADALTWLERRFFLLYPAIELRLGDLGMELDSPARVAQAKALQTGCIFAECDSALR